MELIKHCNFVTQISTQQKRHVIIPVHVTKYFYAPSANCFLVLLNIHIKEMPKDKTMEVTQRSKRHVAEFTFVSRAYKAIYMKYGILLFYSSLQSQLPPSAHYF